MTKTNKELDSPQYIYKVDITIWKENKKKKQIKKIDKSTIGRAISIEQALNMASVNVYRANED